MIERFLKQVRRRSDRRPTGAIRFLAMLCLVSIIGIAGFDSVTGQEEAGGATPSPGASPPAAATPSALAAELRATVKTFPIEDNAHTEEPVEYAQTPPVGGPHHPVPQDCGFYAEPVISEHAVHSLEHGAVWITYDPDLPAEEIAILEDLAGAEAKVLVSPFAGLPAPVVASAWGVQLQLETATDPLLEEFVKTFVAGDQAPEPRAPCAGTDETARA